MGLHLLVRLLNLLRKALLEESGGNWVLLSLDLGGRDGWRLRCGSGSRHGCWGGSGSKRNRYWLNCLYRLC